jgi:aldose 1-epimerase
MRRDVRIMRAPEIGLSDASILLPPLEAVRATCGMESGIVAQSAEALRSMLVLVSNRRQEKLRMKLLHVMLLCMVSAVANAAVTHSIFGKLPDGSVVEEYTLTSPSVELKVISYGARVVALDTKDRNGKMGDIALGYNSIDGYLKDTKTYFGSVPGRYANRIADGRFSIDGQPYQITINDGPNALHGGKVGFDRHNWQSKEVPGGVEFTLVSPDGDQGFPGTLTAHVRYTLSGDRIKIEYSATTDKPTVVNLTNHTYFNLSGEGNPSILNEKLTLDADDYTPVNSTLIPTGKIAPVAGTPFDFRHPATIGSRIAENNEQLKFAGGYDQNFVVRGTLGQLRPAAKVYDPASGRVLSVETDQPGIQFYTGNFLDGTLIGKSGKPYPKRSALCLETQHFPDSPNHANFPSTVLRPGQTFHSETTWTFTTRSSE